MATSNDNGGRRSVLLNFKFLGVSLVGSLTMALVSTFTPLDAQIAARHLARLWEIEEAEKRW